MNDIGKIANKIDREFDLKSESDKHIVVIFSIVFSHLTSSCIFVTFVSFSERFFAVWGGFGHGFGRNFGGSNRFCAGCG